MNEPVVTEGVSGTWFYHLSDPATPHVALCGAKTMPTSVPLKSWGYVGHLKERYCLPCRVATAKDVTA